MARSPLAGALSISAILILPPLLHSQNTTTAIPLELKQFIDIRENVRRSLEQQPNHACQMVVRRARIGEKARKRLRKLARKSGAERFSGTLPPDMIDVVELEVAVVDGKELYAFPDSPRFEERPLHEIVGFGTIGTGDFSSHARSIFVNQNSRTTFVGDERLDGRRSLRWDYTVSLFRSGLIINNAGLSARVAYRGSFWANPETHELLRLTIEAVDIPPSINVLATSTEIDYQRVTLGGETFSSPRRARTSMQLASGDENRNETEFLDCKDFQVESTLSFDDATDRFYVQRVESFETIEIPTGTRLPVKLLTAIDSQQARVGAPVEAELSSRVKLPSGVTLPKGALLSGRIRRFERYTDGEPRTLVGLQLSELSFSRWRADLHLELERVDSDQRLSRQGPPPSVTTRTTFPSLATGSRVTRETIETYEHQDAPGIGLFFVREEAFVVQPGLRMLWRTLGAP